MALGRDLHHWGKRGRSESLAFIDGRLTSDHDRVCVYAGLVGPVHGHPPSSTDENSYRQPS